MNPLWCTLQFPLKGTLGGLYPSGLAVEGPTSPRGKVARFFSPPPSLKPSGTIWNHLKPSETIWNHLELFGTASGLLERPKGNWNSRRLLERPPALDRPQGYFVLFIGSRYYLRPIILWNARRAIGTALRASGTEPWLYLERPQASGTEPLALPGTRLALRDYSNPPSSLPLLPLLPESEPKGKGASTITYKKSKSCS